ncbi:hypothetical protein Lal_00040612 [Lupinus albus]|uniref:Putative pectinesterase inhibitor domain-containing protein n=1 Tax=Lupinus albus TaxID=3870 RepID=A0A6A4PJ63_LUPAL|nr:putative pectinesterase inhibitor domain-containing protein [Lupinus albus]KAF1887558.1 hypothetical protein Lal_00040612 [Lupinus albus]
MKTFNSITLIFSLHTLLFIITIPSSHANIFNPNDETLITFTCSKTPYPDLCLRSFKSNLWSDKVDMWGLAGIMLNHAMKVKANTALAKIDQLGASGTGPIQGLFSCNSKYTTILETDIRKAKAAFDKEDPKGAEDSANDAANEASTCETIFPGYLTEENKNMHDVAANAAAIFKLLHS